MTDSIRLRIREAFVTALGVATVGSVTKPTGLTIHTMRARPIIQDGLPAMVVYLLSEPSPDPRAAGLVDRTIAIGVESRIKVPSATAPDDALDPYATWAVLAVMLDEQLGGIAHRIDEGATQWEVDDEEVTLARTATVFNVRYQSRRNDPRTAT